MTERHLRARPVLPGAARGQALKVATLSLWGGIDSQTGRLIDPQSGHAGDPVAGRVLVIGEPRGSSSSSAVMLELLHAGLAPAAVLLGRIDAILGLGIVVARELGWPTIPLLELDHATIEAIPDGSRIEVRAGGDLHIID